MRVKILTVFFFIFLISCSEEDLPAGLYDYQVERLLSGQSGSKNWAQVVNSDNCADSVILYVELVTISSTDSIDISNLIKSNNCTALDTIFIGRANASKFTGRSLFSDSLNFSSGDYWIVDQITSELLIVGENGALKSYSYRH